MSAPPPTAGKKLPPPKTSPSRGSSVASGSTAGGGSEERGGSSQAPPPKGKAPGSRPSTSPSKDNRPPPKEAPASSEKGSSQSNEGAAGKPSAPPKTAPPSKSSDGSYSKTAPPASSAPKKMPAKRPTPKGGAAPASGATPEDQGRSSADPAPAPAPKKKPMGAPKPEAQGGSRQPTPQEQEAKSEPQSELNQRREARKASRTPTPTQEREERAERDKVRHELEADLKREQEVAAARQHKKEEDEKAAAVERQRQQQQKADEEEASKKREQEEEEAARQKEQEDNQRERVAAEEKVKADAEEKERESRRQQEAQEREEAEKQNGTKEDAKPSPSPANASSGTGARTSPDPPAKGAPKARPAPKGATGAKRTRDAPGSPKRSPTRRAASPFAEVVAMDDDDDAAGSPARRGDTSQPQLRRANTDLHSHASSGAPPQVQRANTTGDFGSRRNSPDRSAKGAPKGRPGKRPSGGGGAVAPAPGSPRKKVTGRGGTPFAKVVPLDEGEEEEEPPNRHQSTKPPSPNDTVHVDVIDLDQEGNSSPPRAASPKAAAGGKKKMPVRRRDSEVPVESDTTRPEDREKSPPRPAPKPKTKAPPPKTASTSPSPSPSAQSPPRQKSPSPEEPKGNSTDAPAKPQPKPKPKPKQVQQQSAVVDDDSDDDFFVEQIHPAPAATNASSGSSNTASGPPPAEGQPAKQPSAKRIIPPPQPVQQHQPQSAVEQRRTPPAAATPSPQEEEDDALSNWLTPPPSSGGDVSQQQLQYDKETANTPPPRQRKPQPKVSASFFNRLHQKNTASSEQRRIRNQPQPASAASDDVPTNDRRDLSPPRRPAQSRRKEVVRDPAASPGGPHRAERENNTTPKRRGGPEEEDDMEVIVFELTPATNLEGRPPPNVTPGRIGGGNPTFLGAVETRGDEHEAASQDDEGEDVSRLRSPDLSVIQQRGDQPELQKLRHQPPPPSFTPRPLAPAPGHRQQPLRTLAVVADEDLEEEDEFSDQDGDFVLNGVRAESLSPLSKAARNIPKEIRPTFVANPPTDEFIYLKVLVLARTFYVRLPPDAPMTKVVEYAHPPVARLQDLLKRNPKSRAPFFAGATHRSRGGGGRFTASQYDQLLDSATNLNTLDEISKVLHASGYADGEGGTPPPLPQNSAKRLRDRKGGRLVSPTPETPNRPAPDNQDPNSSYAFSPLARKDRVSALERYGGTLIWQHLRLDFRTTPQEMEMQHGVEHTVVFETAVQVLEREGRKILEVAECKMRQQIREWSVPHILVLVQLHALASQTEREDFCRRACEGSRAEDRAHQTSIQRKDTVRPDEQLQWSTAPIGSIDQSALHALDKINRNSEDHSAQWEGTLQLGGQPVRLFDVPYFQDNLFTSVMSKIVAPSTPQHHSGSLGAGRLTMPIRRTFGKAVQEDQVIVPLSATPANLQLPVQCLRYRLWELRKQHSPKQDFLVKLLQSAVCTFTFQYADQFDTADAVPEEEDNEENVAPFTPRSRKAMSPGGFHTAQRSAARTGPEYSAPRQRHTTNAATGHLVSTSMFSDAEGEWHDGDGGADQEEEEEEEDNPSFDNAGDGGSGVRVVDLIETPLQHRRHPRGTLGTGGTTVLPPHQRQTATVEEQQRQLDALESYGYKPQELHRGRPMEEDPLYSHQHGGGQLGAVYATNPRNHPNYTGGADSYYPYGHQGGQGASYHGEGMQEGDDQHPSQRHAAHHHHHVPPGYFAVLSEGTGASSSQIAAFRAFQRSRLPFLMFLFRLGVQLPAELLEQEECELDHYGSSEEGRGGLYQSVFNACDRYPDTLEHFASSCALAVDLLQGRTDGTLSKPGSGVQRSRGALAQSRGRSDFYDSTPSRVGSSSSGSATTGGAHSLVQEEEVPRYFSTNHYIHHEVDAFCNRVAQRLYLL